MRLLLARYRSQLAEVTHIAREAHTLQPSNDHVAGVGLLPVPSQPREAGRRVLFAMPILPLEKMPRGKPRHIAARVLSFRDAGLGVTNAIHKALRMQREHDPNRAQPEECGPSEIQSAEK